MSKVGKKAGGRGESSFSDLLVFHLERGTRPNGTPERVGVKWTNKDFAEAVDADERSVRNWLNGTNPPGKAKRASIEKSLFGTNPAYEHWRQELRAAHGRKADKDPGETDPERPPPCNLPYPSLGSLFKGRDEIIERLRDGQAPGRATAIAGKAMHGLGGIGKTRVAIEFAWASRDAHSALLFVPAESAERLQTGLAALAGRDILALSEQEAREDAVKIPAVFRWLARHPGWLMILDNVDDKPALKAVSELLQRLRREGGEGQVLITGRLSSFPPEIATLELGVIATDAAVAYLLAATADRRRQTPQDSDLARKLADELGGLALGLSQAAAYIKARRVGFSDYLTLWQANREKVVGWFDKDAVAYNHDVGLAATWKTSVDCLGPESRRLLERLAFLDPAPVPDTLLAVPVPGEADEADAGAALEDLFTYSLATRAEHEGGSEGLAFTVHRLVQDFTRRGLSEARAREALIESQGWIDAAFDGDPQDVRSWGVLNPLVPHALAVVEAADAVGLTEPTARLMNELGSLNASKARWREAEQLYRRALALDKIGRKNDNADTATILNNLADLLRNVNRLVEAEPLMRRALEISEAEDKPDNRKIVVRLNNLAGLLRATGRLSDAEPLYRRALKIGEDSFGPDDPIIAILVNNLGRLMWDSDRPEEAMSLVRRALTIDEARYGDKHPKVAIRLNNLAVMLKINKHLDEAETLIRRAWKIDEVSYGANHPKISIRIYNLAVLLQATNRIDEAETLMRRALAIDEANYSPNHPTIAQRLKSLGNLLKETNRFDEAESVMRRAQEIQDASQSKRDKHDCL